MTPYLGKNIQRFSLLYFEQTNIEARQHWIEYRKRVSNIDFFSEIISVRLCANVDIAPLGHITGLLNPRRTVCDLLRDLTGVQNLNGCGHQIK